MANKFLIQKSDNFDKYIWVLMFGDEVMCKSIEYFYSVDAAKEDISKMKKACTKYTKVEIKDGN